MAGRTFQPIIRLYLATLRGGTPEILGRISATSYVCLQRASSQVNLTPSFYFLPHSKAAATSYSMLTNSGSHTRCQISVVWRFVTSGQGVAVKEIGECEPPAITRKPTRRIITSAYDWNSPSYQGTPSSPEASHYNPPRLIISLWRSIGSFYTMTGPVQSHHGDRITSTFCWTGSKTQCSSTI